MELTKTRSKVITDLSFYTGLIYGEEGIGKSTLCSQMDNPYFIATEPGHKAMEVFKSDVSSWDEFRDVARELVMSKEHKYKTVVIDTVTNLVDFCASSVYEQHNISHMSDLEWGKGFALVKDEFKKVLIPLCNSSLGVIFVAHDMLREMEFHGAKRDVWCPNMIKTASTVINQIVDFIGRMFVSDVEVAGEIRQYRFIRFYKCTDMITKDRTGLLERHGDIMLPEKDKMWNTLMSCFQNKTNTQKKKEVTSG